LSYYFSRYQILIQADENSLSLKIHHRFVRNIHDVLIPYGDIQEFRYHSGTSISWFNIMVIKLRNSKKIKFRVDSTWSKDSDAAESLVRLLKSHKVRGSGYLADLIEVQPNTTL